MGAVQAVRMTLERDIMETFGVANDRNIHYYANVTGYNEVPAFVMSDSGPHPAALACRTRAAMTMGRRFARKLDFGPTGNRIFLGLEYRGEDGSTVMLRNLGTLDQNLDLRARGGRSLEVVDAFGNATKVPVRVRKARLTVSRMPLYIRLSRNQRISVPRLDMGRNVAGEASFSYSGGTGSDLGLLADGLFQNPHLGSPWGPMWKGAYAGRTFDEKPETLEIVFPAPRTVAGVLVFGARADDGHCALLDYDLQFRDGGVWATLDEVRSPCPPSDRVRVYHSNDGGDAMHPGFYTTACAWFMDDSFFVHRLARPVKTDGLRLVIRRITRGFAPDEAAERAAVVGAPAGQPLQAQSLELREIEVYGGR